MSSFDLIRWRSSAENCAKVISANLFLKLLTPILCLDDLVALMRLINDRFEWTPMAIQELLSSLCHFQYLQFDSAGSSWGVSHVVIRDSDWEDNTSKKGLIDQARSPTSRPLNLCDCVQLNFVYWNTEHMIGFHWMSWLRGDKRWRFL